MRHRFFSPRTRYVFRFLFISQLVFLFVLQSILPAQAFFESFANIFQQSDTTSDIYTKSNIDVPTNENEYVSSEVIVQFHESWNLASDEGKKSVESFSKEHGLALIEILPGEKRIARFSFDKGGLVNKLREIRTSPEVTLVQPNFRYEPQAISTNDTHRGLLWGLDNTGQTVNGVSGTVDADIDAPEAWAISEGEAHPVTVAVIDTGVAYNHPDLSANMWDGSSCVDDSGNALGGCLHGYDFENGDVNPEPQNDHGTNVASIIAATKNNGSGVIGVAPHAVIMAIRFDFTTAGAVRAINFASRNGAKVINASWGTSVSDPTLKAAIENFDGLFVAAAGNSSGDNDATPMYPCAFDSSNIICVTATDQNDALASFSNYGQVSVDMGAPGVNLYSTSGYILAAQQDFESASAPALPVGFSSVQGNIGTVDIGGSDGNVLYGDINRSPYSDSSNSLITSPVIDMSHYVGAYVDFNASCDTEYNASYYADYLRFKTSGDSINYSDVTASIGGFEVPWFIDEANNDFLNEDSDPSGAASYTYNEFLNIDPNTLSSSFNYGVQWISNATDNNHDGCFIDNVAIYGIGDGSGASYRYMNGTSFAAPYVAGAAALLWGYNSSLSVSDAKAMIVSQGDSLSALASVTTSGRRLNINKTLQFATTSKDITEFHFVETNHFEEFIGGDSSATINVPYGTDVTSLTPVIIHNGASISPASGVTQDFSSPVTYHITAKDGSIKDYIVTVNVRPNTAKAITGFSFSSPAVTGVIHEDSGTISVQVPYGTNITSLVPTIIHTGASISPMSGVAQDFTSPVTYTVTAEDNSTTSYTVTVTREGDPFSSVDLSFRKKDVSKGKTSKEDVDINFDGIDRASEYMVSKHEDFSGADWESLDGRDKITVSLKKKSGTQRFYFRFRDSYGNVSETYTKKLEYAPEKYVLKQSSRKIKRGETLIQTGKHFSKNTVVELYFSKPGGGFYPKMEVNTDKNGNFSVSYKVRKALGTYAWYAIDTKTGKKAKEIKYSVVE